MVTRSGVLAIVPARGGSKSVPRKNVRPLAGMPLIAYSIAAGLEAGCVDRVIVSTDDEEIADISKQFGADVPFMRPAELALDRTPDLPVFQHALDWLEHHEEWLPEIVVQLRPTSPLRPPGCVDAAVERLRVESDAHSVRAVTVASQNPFKMWQVWPDGAMTPLIEVPGRETFNEPRQDLETIYWQTGHVDAVRTSTIRLQQSMSGAQIRALLVDPVYACDIDTEADWARTEWMLSRFTYPLVRPQAPETLGRSLLRDLDLIVFDFDGVFTDNRVWTAANGQEWVSCDRSDGLGLKLLRQLDLDLLVLSTEDNPVVSARCRKLRVEVEHGVPDKGVRLRQILAERGINPAHVMYVGNDVNDVDCMRMVGCAVAVSDAHPEVLAIAHFVLSKPGGRGAVRELCDVVRERISRRVLA